MRMRQKSREDTVALYREEMLAGKSEKFIEVFNAKDTNRQYQAVMNWRRTQRKKQTPNNEKSLYTFAYFVKIMRDAEDVIENLTVLNTKDREKALELVEFVKSKITNFEKIKKQRILDDLMKEEELINKQGDNIRKRIADLKKELE